MSISQRDMFFSSLLTGAMTDPGFSPSGENLRYLWRLADLSVYHSRYPSTPEETARRWMKKNYVIVDTETTGLGSDAQIVEIAIIDCSGNILLNTLVKPSVSIPAQATAVHGITDEMVCDAPSWIEVVPSVVESIGDNWIAYNAKFDERMIEQSSKGLLVGSAPLCAMQLCAEFFGEWDVYHRKYKWKKLVEAATPLNVWPDVADTEKPHRALYDCRLTLGVIRAIAGVEL